LDRLKDHCDPALRAAAWKSLQEPDAEVQTAALTALIASATAQDVAPLADLASTAEDGHVRDAARKTLRLMPAAGTNRAMVSLLEGADRLHPVLVECALARRSTEFVPAFLQAARSPDAAVRLAALKALAIMATDQDVESLIGLLRATAPGAERAAADRAVWMSCQKIPDRAQRPAPLLAALEQADLAGQTAILPSLARLGGDQALAAVHRAMQSPDQALRDAGYRALANWPDASVANELLDIVRTSPVQTHRIWALRAYARVVSLPSKRPPQQTFEMLRQAMLLATRTDDRALIVTRLGAVRVPDALALLLSLVDDPQLRQVAVPAVFELAKGLSRSHPDAARAALEKVRLLSTDQAILKQIPRVLRDLKKAN
jgi:HEAT repeat protein